MGIEPNKQKRCQTARPKSVFLSNENQTGNIRGLGTFTNFTIVTFQGNHYIELTYKCYKQFWLSE